MANKWRFRHGQMELIKFPVESGTVIERGDMLFFGGSDEAVHPASEKEWDTNLATTQAAFANVFAGIAYEASPNGETEDISVDTSPDSVYEFDVASATYLVGDDLGPDQDSTTVLMDQQLEGAAATSDAVARAYEKKASASTTLKVKFASAYNVAANNVNAVVG